MPKEKSDKLQNIYIYILVLKAERFGWKTKNKKEVKHRKQLGERKMNFLRRVISPGSRSQVSQFANRSFKITQKHYGSIAQPTSSSLVHGIHQFHCPDVVGILAKLSDCIASREGNILSADIFVPDDNHVFYSRSEFLFDPAKWPREQMDADFSNLAKKFNAMKSVVRVPDTDPKYKISILASKQEHCLVDLLHGWQDGRFPIHITSVISNHERGPNTHVIRFLERHGIPYYYLPMTKENKREKEILDIVGDTDFLVLARYMQVLSGDFLKSYKKDIINIHHGLLPSFKGSNPSKQAFDAGVKLIGATTHFVSEELDSGPIIEQLVERVSHRDNLRTFIQKSEDVEKRCLAKAIKSYCELRIFPYEANKTVVFRS
ncbi:formyltetrahydrofolate deformylase 2, mitochondrial [Solanum lycopersicum]|uniref:formyltetrahydrofolate deformylase 2, mitochondrial n=1 Tax=Solanum lycopersicum TaxID=4081 RepID=UPI00374A61D1